MKKKPQCTNHFLVEIFPEEVKYASPCVGVEVLTYTDHKSELTFCYTILKSTLRFNTGSNADPPSHVVEQNTEVLEGSLLP